MKKYLQNRVPNFILAFPVAVPISFLMMILLLFLFLSIAGLELGSSQSPYGFLAYFTRFLTAFTFGVVFLFLADTLKVNQDRQWSRSLAKELRTFLIMFYVFTATAITSGLLHFLPFSFFTSHLEITSKTIGWHDIIFYLIILVTIGGYTNKYTQHPSYYYIIRFVLYSFLNIPLVIFLVSLWFHLGGSDVFVPWTLPILSFLGGTVVLFPLLSYILPIQK